MPQLEHPMVCRYCSGAKDVQYTQCWGCKMLLDGGASSALMQRLVPISMAPDPGAWYRRMSLYKGPNARESEYLVASAVAHFVRFFESQINATLGGPPDCICITPSKRGVPYEQQPLKRIAVAARNFLPPVTGLVALRSGQTWNRHEYKPQAFDGDSRNIEGRRIILLEDTVVTGGTVVSVAGRLEELGAAQVMIMPVARRFETNPHVHRYGDDSPYLRALERPWTPETDGWPRVED